VFLQWKNISDTPDLSDYVLKVEEPILVHTKCAPLWVLYHIPLHCYGDAALAYQGSDVVRRCHEVNS